MSRFSRINTIWRKELIDTLRDRRTLIAMVLVPIVLYPALMLGSLQAFEVQVSYLTTQTYDIAVPDDETAIWLRHLIDTDPARRPLEADVSAEELAAQAAEPLNVPPPGSPQTLPARDDGAAPRSVRSGVRDHPPQYRVHASPDLTQAVLTGEAQVALELRGPPPRPGSSASTTVRIEFDDTDLRSQIAATGLEAVLTRANERMLFERLSAREIEMDFLHPLALQSHNVATPERMAGAILGQIVPLILIVMTITGAIYPAIDLTAGERERGTLETLMVAPVPAVDLIAGKFVVVTLIGLLSALLNLLSIGGTVYLGGVGSLLMQGAQMELPLSALPWIFVLLVPLAVLFSACLLAVCSFARSFKEAQNYIVPVMLAAMIPGVVGVLPGTRLEGPMLVMPVANIVVLTRELFLSKFDFAAIGVVFASTSLYAAAAVAIAARLFGQEAVLFADSGSLKTVFQRRFFEKRLRPTTGSALLALAIVFTLNFLIQNAIGARWQGLAAIPWIAATMIVLMALAPLAATVYMRCSVRTTFELHAPPPLGIMAALCFGLSTWLLARIWFAFQERWLPLSEAARRAIEEQSGWVLEIHPALVLLAFALVPALCEELFFRGFALSGVRSSLDRRSACVVVALAFALTHYMAQRFVVTAALGLVLGLMVVQFRSIWPAVLAHFMHNGISIMAAHPDGLGRSLAQLGFDAAGDGAPPPAWTLGAVVLFSVGFIATVAARPGRGTPPGANAPGEASYARAPVTD